MNLMQVDINRLPGLPNMGVIVGGLGTLITILYMICSQRMIHAQTHEDAEHKLFSLKETFIHNAEETAFVGTWVFAAYLVYELGVYIGGFIFESGSESGSGFTFKIGRARVGKECRCRWWADE